MGIAPHVVENSPQLDLPTDKRFLTATLPGEPFVFALFDFQFAVGAVHGSLCGIAPILIDLTSDDLRQPAYHLGAKLGQVIRRDRCKAANGFASAERVVIANTPLGTFRQKIVEAFAPLQVDGQRVNIGGSGR